MTMTMKMTMTMMMTTTPQIERGLSDVKGREADLRRMRKEKEALEALVTEQTNEVR